jgi:hypothetical protein
MTTGQPGPPAGRPGSRETRELTEGILVQQGPSSEDGPRAPGRFALPAGTLISSVALAFSGFGLWETALKQADVSVHVPAVVHYSSPYTNSNFEMIAIPVTLVNDGARTGTVLGIDLAVTDPRTNETKRFYAADFGRWSMERTRAGAYQPFAPISLAGRSSRSESVLFHTRGDGEKPPQLIRELGAYRFTLTVQLAESGGGLFASNAPRPLTFERELRFYDARAFTNGTIPMFDPGFTSAKAP